MEKSPYLCSAISNQTTMATQKKTPYYLILEITGDVTQSNIPTSAKIRGLYTTQAKAIAELFHIATRHQGEGAIFNTAYTDSHLTPISELIHSQTINGETTMLGYNPDKEQLIELQIKPLTLDIRTLITI